MYTLNCRGKLVVIDQPMVMGIINTTPDSFFANSRKTQVEEAVATAMQMQKAGAAMVDIGGQSTRPGADWVGATEETDRVVPVIAAIAAACPNLLISVDTFHAAVAEAAVQAGAHIVNDVSGGHLDAAMLPTVGRLQVPYICMHMKGTPGSMNQLAEYNNLLTDILDYFIERLAACTAAGINDIIIDPGFGFAKTTAHNFQLLRQLEVLHTLQRPLLMGISRKRTIYQTLGTTAAEALNGTTVLNTIGLQKGVHILRVHDVQEAVEAVKLVTAMQQA